MRSGSHHCLSVYRPSLQGRSRWFTLQYKLCVLEQLGTLLKLLMQALLYGRQAGLVSCVLYNLNALGPHAVYHRSSPSPIVPQIVGLGAEQQELQPRRALHQRHACHLQPGGSPCVLTCIYNLLELLLPWLLSICRSGVCSPWCSEAALPALGASAADTGVSLQHEEGSSPLVTSLMKWQPRGL